MDDDSRAGGGPRDRGPRGDRGEGADPAGDGAEQLARRRAATALRRLVHGLIGRQAPIEVLDAFSTEAERHAARLEAAPARRRPDDGMRVDIFDQVVADGAVVDHFSDCPVSGATNPLAPTMQVRRRGEAVEARVQLGPAFEGAPGRAHGGVVAAVFDDVMGFLCTVHGVATYAGELTVRYLAPTPIDDELVVTAWIAERFPRKLRTEASARHRGEVVAHASCIGVIIEPERLGRATYDDVPRVNQAND